jgi:hypothetical protein
MATLPSAAVEGGELELQPASGPADKIR